MSRGVNGRRKRLREYEKAVGRCGGYDRGHRPESYRFLIAKPSVFGKNAEESDEGASLWGISFLRYWAGKYLRLSSNLNWMSVSRVKTVTYEMEILVTLRLGERDLLLSYFPIEGVHGS